MAYLEAVEVAKKLDPEKSMNIYPKGLNPKSGEVNQEKGVAWDRKMSDFGENVEDLKAAGMDVGLLQPTQASRPTKKPADSSPQQSHSSR